MTSKKDPIHYKHETVVFVPCFQKNPEPGETGSPTFTYSLADATSDEQMAYSMNPDYVLVLKGEFDAKTQPYDLDVVRYNQGIRND